MSAPTEDPGKRLGIIKRLHSDLAIARGRLAAFAAELSTPGVPGKHKSRLQLISGATSVFDAAAVEQVFEAVIHSFANANTIAFIREYATTQALNKAEHPPHSSSPCSNLAEQYEAAAWAKVVDIIRWRA